MQTPILPPAAAASSGAASSVSSGAASSGAVSSGAAASSFSAGAASSGAASVVPLVDAGALSPPHAANENIIIDAIAIAVTFPNNFIVLNPPLICQNLAFLSVFLHIYILLCTL